MLIKSIGIENFRCFENETITFEVLTAILGRNGGGKSTILSAMEIFYDTNAPITVDDFYSRLLDCDIKVQVVYGDFRPGAEQEEFQPYLRDGLMAVSKVIRWNNGRVEQRYYASFRQIPQLSQVRSKKNKTEQVNEWNSLVDQGALPDAEKLPTRGADLEAALQAYEREHPELLEWVDKEEQFFGPKNIGGGKLDKYTKFVRVPAVRDATDDMAEKRGSPLFQLLDMLVLRRVNAREDVRRLKAEFGERVKQTYNPENLTELGDLSTDITKTLQWFVPNAKLNLIWTDAKIPEIPNPSYYSELEEDEFSGAINRKGHGLQRALIFSILQHLAVAKPAKVEDAEADTVQPTTKSDEPAASIPDVATIPAQNVSQVDIPPDLILAIDEPELYQHPLRSRHLVTVLQRMTEDKDYSLGARNQVIYTTHSPYFVNLKCFEQIRIVRKCKTNPQQAPCSTVSHYTFQKASQELALVTGGNPKEFTAESFYAHSYPVMTLAVNEGFFADVVVLVEGLTEVAAITTVADIMNQDWTARGVAVIAVDGKNKIDRAAVIFRGLNIPTYIVFDGDVRHKGDRDMETKEIKTNRILLSLAGAEPEDFPKDGAYAQHACFEDEFETYVTTQLSPSLLKQYRGEAAEMYGYKKDSDALKNYGVCVDFVKRVYQEMHSFPLIEEVVRKATALIPG